VIGTNQRAFGDHQQHDEQVDRLVAGFGVTRELPLQPPALRAALDSACAPARTSS